MGGQLSQPLLLQQLQLPDYLKRCLEYTGGNKWTLGDLAALVVLLIVLQLPEIDILGLKIAPT